MIDKFIAATIALFVGFLLIYFLDIFQFFVN